MNKEEKGVTIEVIEGFKFAHRGVEVREYSKGETVEVEAECAEIAIREKWAKPGKARKEAPENKDAGAPPENKGKE